MQDRVIPFSKWDPSGNVTLLFPDPCGVPRAALAAWALEARHAGAEQAGFCSRKGRTMAMAGNEFCVNATRSFGAFLAWRDELEGGAAGPQSRRYTVRVSGWERPVDLEVRGAMPAWQVTAILSGVHPALETVAPGLCRVRLPGIVHVLADTRRHPLPHPLLPTATDMLAGLGLLDEEAAGIVWWGVDSAGRPGITPVVRVRDIGSLCAEQSCGSGSMALALLLARETGLKEHTVAQPGGDTLTVAIEGDAAKGISVLVSGEVRLVCEGSLHYPVPEEGDSLSRPMSR